jgi:predicted  nucleic acid-binding Zn-ribbon protein
MKDAQINELNHRGKDIKEDSKKYLNQINSLNKRLENLTINISSLNQQIAEIEKEGLNSKNVK